MYMAFSWWCISQVFHVLILSFKLFFTQVHVDADRNLVYFTANKDTPLEKHLYCVCLVTGLVQRLTTIGSNHQALVNEVGTLTYSGIVIYVYFQMNVLARQVKVDPFDFTLLSAEFDCTTVICRVLLHKCCLQSLISHLSARV